MQLIDDEPVIVRSLWLETAIVVGLTVLGLALAVGPTVLIDAVVFLTGLTAIGVFYALIVVALLPVQERTAAKVASVTGKFVAGAVSLVVVSSLLASG